MATPHIDSTIHTRTHILKCAGMHLSEMGVCMPHMHAHTHTHTKYWLCLRLLLCWAQQVWRLGSLPIFCTLCWYFTISHWLILFIGGIQRTLFAFNHWLIIIIYTDWLNTINIKCKGNTTWKWVYSNSQHDNSLCIQTVMEGVCIIPH